jgi:hypothetical protein
MTTTLEHPTVGPDFYGPPKPDLQGLDHHARTYADRRTRREALDAAVQADLEGSPQLAAVAAARQAYEEANNALLAFAAIHPRRAELVQLSAEEEAAKKALLEAWPAAVRAGTGKTISLPTGRLQLRTTEGVTVTDAALLCQDLATKGLFRAAVKEVKVDAKLLRPLVDARSLAGAEARDTHTIAWTPKEA